MDETDFTDIKKSPLPMVKSRQTPINKKSVLWVKNSIKAYDEDAKTIPTNGFGEIQFTGATRKAKGKVGI